jgi:predicted nuclease of predicted toxin-antitoxin system
MKLEKEWMIEKFLNFLYREKRILITFDKDFGRLAVKEKQNCVGVILLRVTPVSVQYVKNRLLYLFSNFADFEGKLFVIEENVIRERKLY